MKATCQSCQHETVWNGTETGERTAWCPNCKASKTHTISDTSLVPEVAVRVDNLKATTFPEPLKEGVRCEGSGVRSSKESSSSSPSQPSPPNMFLKLSNILTNKCDTITMTVARASDTELRVNFIPRFTHDVPAVEKGLNTPLQVVATPAELDSPQFLETLSRYHASATSLAAATETVEAAHKAAAEEAKAPKGKDKTPAQVALKKTDKKPESKPAPKKAEAPKETTSPLGI